MSKSKLGSALRLRFDTSFFRQVGHSLLPDRRAVTIQSLQNRCKHSFVVIVFFSISRQMGHISSLCKLRGDTAISVLSVMASWGVRCSSYRDSSHVLFRPICSDAVIIVQKNTKNRSKTLQIAYYDNIHHFCEWFTPTLTDENDISESSFKNRPAFIKSLLKFSLFQ